MRKLCLLIFLVVFILLVSGCNGGGPVRKAHVTILATSFATYRSFIGYGWTAQIGGTAINDGDYYLRYAEVVGAIYDDHWRMLDQQGDTRVAWRKREQWCFEIYCHSNYEPHHYKVWVGRIRK